MLDRIKKAIFGVVRAGDPRAPYAAPFYGRVVKQSGNTVDVVPDDDRMPPQGLSKVPLRHGAPGLEVTVAPGTSVLIGFENGDPGRARAFLWQGGETVERIVFNATTFVAGGAGGAQPPPLGLALNKVLGTFLNVLATQCTGVVSLPQVAAAINAIGPAATTLLGELADTLATNTLVK